MKAFLNSLVLLGSLQGLIISALLYYRKPGRLTSRLLGALIFFIALASANVYLNNQGWFASSHFFQTLDTVLPMVIAMPLGPLFYFYTKATLNPDFILAKRDRFHFYPVLIDLLPSLVATLYLLGVLARLIPNHPGPIGSMIDGYNRYADIPRWVSLAVYLVLSAGTLSSNRKKEPGERKSPLFRWVEECQAIFTGILVVWVLYLIPYIIPRYSDRWLRVMNWYPIFIPLAILIYWVGLKGYFVEIRMDIPAKTGKQSAGLPKETLDQAVMLIVKAMEVDRLYLDRRLNLDRLARYTGLSPKTISAVLNRHLQKSFAEFVNEYRVHAFQEKIRLADAGQFTIAAIAADCGFNSLATFQRTFRQCTGCSPSEFQKKCSNRDLRTDLF
ncbi:MAG TPA: helix-turn-helix domain-containing protein [Puia sp.]|jgi:AraC-like DNA-binding protein|nr:helix-turn-helix domain-containing protein [Puia sp.]